MRYLNTPLIYPNMKKTILASILILFSTTLYAQISGQVTDNKNKPLSNVVMTDGYTCTRTDAQGQFTLAPNENARFVAITKPSQWRTQGRHYIKIENGAKYNFVLEKSPNEKNSNFSFVQITDVESFTKKGWIDNLRDWVASNPTAFVVNTGDICYERGLRFNGTQLRSEHFGTDFFYCIGNHDLVDGKYGEEMFETYFGPTYYSFDAGNIHFMVLPMLGGDRRPSYTLKQLMDWMRQDLALKDPAKKVVMFNHDLWFTGDNLKIASQGDTLDMAEYGLSAFLYGHWHSHYATEVAGIKTFSNSSPDKGGIDHGASVFRVLNVDNMGQITSQTRYTHITGAVSSAVPAAGDRLKKGVNKFSINTYRSASPTTSVRVQINGKWTAMQPTSDWNWVADISLGAGDYKMLSEATFADGTVLVDNTLFSVSDNPVVEWNNTARGNIWMVQPIVSGQRVFTATIDDDNNQQCYVIAYDVNTGAELWRAKTDNSLKNTIAAADNKVVACDSDGKLYCFAADNGSLLWKTELSNGLLPHTLQGITISDDVVYAGQGNGFSAVNLSDGKIVWNNTQWGGGQGTTSTITANDNVVIASSHWNGIFAHDKQSGKMLWKSQDANTRFRDGSPTFCSDTLFLATTNKLMKIEARTGKVLQSENYDVDFSVAAAPLLTPNVIYCATSNKGIAAFDRHTLKQLWGYNSAPAMFYSVPYSQDFQCSVESSPVLYNDVVIFAATDGNLYGVNAKNGSTEFKRRLGSPIFSTPTVQQDNLLVSDFAGNIMKLNLKNLK